MVCVMFRYRRACTVLVNHNADYPLYTYTALSTFDMHAAASSEQHNLMYLVELYHRADK